MTRYATIPFLTILPDPLHEGAKAPETK